MRKTIGVTQRVGVDPQNGERRDSLDQRWYDFLDACGLLPLPIPNHPALARELVERSALQGVLLTGGNDLAAYGGDAPERDRVELALIEDAANGRFPLLGVCRGMQCLLQWAGVKLERVTGHVAASQTIRIEGKAEAVNSYHQWGAREVRDPFTIWAQAEDGVIKAIRHRRLPIAAMMWHPERLAPAAARDIVYFKHFFGG